MIEALYKAYDRTRRPLRDHHFFYAPAAGMACARIPHSGSGFIRDFLISRLCGDDRRNVQGLWVDGLELVTARKLRKLDPGIFTIALVRNPGTRLAAAFREQIVERGEISETWRMLGFAGGMSFDAFALRVCEISDLRADSHFRSQFAMLSSRGRIIAHSVLRLEQIEADWARMRRAARDHGVSDPGPLPEISCNSLDEDWKRYADLPAGTRARLRLRYNSDYETFYSGFDADLGGAVFGVQESEQSVGRKFA